MANLKEIRTRIASVSSTRQITSAMKMVSAAKLRKAQEAIILLRPYAEKLYEILAMLNANFTEDENPFAIQRDVHRVLIIAVTSNRGLCGTFNTNILKGSLQIAYEKYPKQLKNQSLIFMPIGKKGYDFFTKKNYQVHPGNYNHLLDGAGFEKTATVVQLIMHAFKDKTYDRVEIVYNQFKNAAVQIPVAEQFLPFKQEKVKHERVVTKALYNDFIFEPSKEQIIRELVPKSLEVNFFKVILDSLASEHGARMTSMHKATDNASELIRDLKLEYNKARQSAITNEILEIVSGANAQKG
jgi:F-type H+-transporting ATPase subunit gamma